MEQIQTTERILKMAIKVLGNNNDINPVTRNNQDITVEEYCFNIHPYLEFDENLQRGLYSKTGIGDEGAWTQKEEEEFIDSIYKNKVTNPITWFDIVSCLSYSERIGDEGQKQFKLAIDNNKKYTSVVGGNRGRTLVKYLEGKLKYNGRYCGSGDNDWCSIEFKNKTIPTCQISDGTRRDAHDLFGREDKGVKQNRQEQRNSWYKSPEQEKIKKLSKQTTDINNLVSGIQINRLGDAQFDSERYSYRYNVENKGWTTGVNNNDIDGYYKSKKPNTFPREKETEKLYRDLSRCHGKITKKKINKASQFNFWQLICWFEKDYRIKVVKENREKFYEVWWNQEEIRRDLEEQHFSKNSKNKPSNMTYDEYCRGTEPNKLETRLNVQIRDFYEGVTYGGQTYSFDGLYTAVDPQRGYNLKQAKEIWLRDEGLDEEGNVIPYHKIGSSEYQIDHVDEWADGNPTSVENGKIMTVEGHKQKTKEYMKKRNAKEKETEEV